MKPVLIFDLDDTLILQDHMTRMTVDYCTAFLGLDREGFWTAFQEISQRLFAELPTYPFCRALGISAQEGLWGQFGGPLPELGEMRRLIPEYRFQVWHQSLSRWGFPDAHLAREISSDFVDLRGRRYYPFPGTHEVLSSLKPSYSLAILTNGAPELQWSKIHKSGLEELFDSITVSGDYGVGKPRKELFEIVFAKHPQGSRFLMIGNSLTSDVQGALNAGIPVVHFLKGDEPSTSEFKPHGVIGDLKELESLLPQFFPQV